MKAELQKAIDLIIDKGKQMLIAQGHDVTHELLNSLTAKVTEGAGELWGEEYGLAQETGVQAGKIKPSRAYIAAVTEWVKNKGIEQGIKARGVAFAIGKTHFLKGMHTKGGQFAPEKQGWLSDTVISLETDIDTLIEKGAEKDITFVIDKMWDEALRNIQ